jgi:hypothetical protein
MIFLSGDISEFYTYRTANIEISLSIELSETEIKQLSKYIEREGHRMDNHICWKNTKGLYFRYSDGKLSIGHRIIIERW